MSTNCIDCCKIIHKSEWSKCLDIPDSSGNMHCPPKVVVPSNSVLQPNPPHHSRRFRMAQVVKNPGYTAYGRWSSAKWNKTTKKYMMLGGRKSKCLG